MPAVTHNQAVHLLPEILAILHMFLVILHVVGDILHVVGGTGDEGIQCLKKNLTMALLD